MYSSLPWTVVGPASHGVSRAPWYSRSQPQQPVWQLRDSHPLWCALPGASLPRLPAAERSAERSAGLTTPAPQRLPPWHGAGLGCSPFRSPLLRAVFYFLRVVRCFSSPGSLRLLPVPPVAGWRVAPFGDGGIAAWLPLPHPIAAGQRPSSAAHAQASPDCVSCLAWSPASRPPDSGSLNPTNARPHEQINPVHEYMITRCYALVQVPGFSDALPR